MPGSRATTSSRSGRSCRVGANLRERNVSPGGAPMKCTRCREEAWVEVRRHNAAYCGDCFQRFFRDQVERAIGHDKMFSHEDQILVAVSGGKDSLALWDVLLDLGYDADGLYIDLGIGEYSGRSRVMSEQFAAARN